MMSRCPTKSAPALRPPGSTSCPGRGFTLLEVLLALALLAVLLGSVLSAVRFYGHLATLGREELQRQRLLLTLDRLLRQDLQSVLLPEEQSETAASAAQPSETSADGASPELLASEETIWGLVGDDRSLVLVVRKSPQELVLMADTASEEQSPLLGDLRLVGYLLAGTEGDELAALVAQQAGQAQGTDSPATGLARWELPLLQGQLALEQQDLDQLAAAAQVLAPEVTSVQFRYFDGTQWVQSWDSTAEGTLPLAVEITLSLLPQGTAPREATTTQQAEETARLVVFLPGAVSAPPSEAGAMP